ncbi:MAG: dipeptide epimerase [Pirellulaceae bacterium]|nr:dipeptide epimerase [Pirellulaceae bacterium]
MIQLQIKTFDLPLRDPFTISRSTTTVQPTMIVELHCDGLVGLGEATANDYYGASLENMSRVLHEIAPRLADLKLENPAEVWRELDPILSANRFAQCALDCALWDLFAQQHQLPLYRLWGFDEDAPCPPTCYTLGIDTPEVMLRKMQAFPNWPIYKIKLNQETGLTNVEYLRPHTQATFRVDANCSWRPEQILPLAERLATMNVELIEQPLTAEAYADMRPLKGKSPLPLMADESCQVESDVDRCIDSFDAINIKLVKCGGLTPARRMIARAKQNGLKVMVGCMTESSVGIAAGVHLLPLLDFADLDGALLLAHDIAEGIRWQAGYCVMPTQAGLGVKLI